MDGTLPTTVLEIPLPMGSVDGHDRASGGDSDAVTKRGDMPMHATQMAQTIGRALARAMPIGSDWAQVQALGIAPMMAAVVVPDVEPRLSDQPSSGFTRAARSSIAFCGVFMPSSAASASSLKKSAARCA
jgi:hypothetical protein